VRNRLTVATSAILAALFLLAPAARADYEDSFAKGIAAMDQHNWNEAVRRLSAAIQENPKEGGRVLLYGQRYRTYLPHYYLGVAYQNLGNCDAARREWAESERQGMIQQESAFKELQQLRPKCEGASTARPEVVASGPPVVSPTTRASEPAPAANATPQPEQRAEAAPAPVVRPTSAVIPVQPTAIARSVPTVIPPPKAPPPPDSLVVAATAYFQGDYAVAARRLAAVQYPDLRATAQARLFRAASNYGLFLMGGEKDKALLDQAARDIRECKSLDPTLKLSAKAFSPRFADLFERSKG
jgi:tetratricopeptide (TPR) repeat protein